MTRMLQQALAAMVDSYGRGADLALLFDYDGTLVPIAPRPELAVLNDATRERLERLAQLPSITVAVLSGRSIDDLKAAVALDGLYYAGTNGLELDMGGAPVVHPESARGESLIASVAERIEPALLPFPAAWVERKRLGISVHYRQVPLDRIAALKQSVTQATEPYSAGLQMLDGSMAIEIVPDLGWTKSSALLSIIEHIGRKVVPLCAGDDANDAGALFAAHVLGGVAIGVGPRAPATARYRLPSPRSLAGCLDELEGMLARTGIEADESSAEG